MVIAIAICLGVLTVVWVLWNLTLDALWQPTDRRTVRRMLFLAKLQPGETVVDLGCGDGRIVIAAARLFGARGIGIEIDPARVLWARVAAFLLGERKNVQILLQDMYKADLSDADVVFLFLSSEANCKLQTKLVAHLHRGARIVSYYHPMQGWRPEKVDAGSTGNPIFLYRINKNMAIMRCANSSNGT
jgi:SAM-dependent methyltransferase